MLALLLIQIAVDVVHRRQIPAVRDLSDVAAHAGLFVLPKQAVKFCRVAGGGNAVGNSLIPECQRVRAPVPRRALPNLILGHVQKFARLAAVLPKRQIVCFRQPAAEATPGGALRFIVDALHDRLTPAAFQQIFDCGALPAEVEIDDRPRAASLDVLRKPGLFRRRAGKVGHIPPYIRTVLALAFRLLAVVFDLERVIAPI